MPAALVHADGYGGTLARAAKWPRGRIYRLNRIIICTVVVGSLGSLLIVPENVWLYAADVLVRTYLTFIGTVMAHEATHWLVGKSRRANLWWGRLALVPSMVPYSNFRKTHLLHHRYTNDPDRDPDHYVKPQREWELPLRALGMPHHWFLWLRSRGDVDRAHLCETALNYLGLVCIYLPILMVVGPARLIWGMLPVLVLVSLLLWYPFAYKTHEGFSTGSARTRSHDYYGAFMYWFSLGLSMHRAHHMYPQYAWIDLRQFVQEDPSARFSFLPRRNIQRQPESETA